MDTNVFLQMFGQKSPYRAIERALFDGQIELAVSNEILLEYEEQITHHSGSVRWQTVANVIESLSQLHGNVFRATPQYRYNIIDIDPDDNKFVDCAITANAVYIITDDGHFNVVAASRSRPQVISPQTFIDQFLSR